MKQIPNQTVKKIAKTLFFQASRRKGGSVPFCAQRRGPRPSSSPPTSGPTISGPGGVGLNMPKRHVFVFLV
jgi:hypothetical protein